MTRRDPLLALFGLLAMAAAPPAPRRDAASGIVHVWLDTGAGPIVLAIDRKHAPITAANFLAYVDQRRFDGTSFYRAARGARDKTHGLVQGGINHNMPKSLMPIAHEPTSRTGLRHVDGTLSMARNAPGTAMGDFFITVGPAPALDAGPGYPGYAAFGHVVSGMDAVRRILAAPTYPGGWSYDTKGQSIVAPVPIRTARRVP